MIALDGVAKAYPTVSGRKIVLEDATVRRAAETIKTRSGSKTMGLDPTTHRLYVPAAEYKPTAAGARGRPAMVPGSFVVLVYGP